MPGFWFPLVTALALGQPSPLEDEKVLAEAGLQPQGTELLQFLTRRTKEQATPARLKEWVKELGNEAFEIREQATARLISLGPTALEELTKATQDSDVEISRRAKSCIQKIEEGGRRHLVSAVIRVAARKQAPGTLGVFLEYGRLADSEQTFDDLVAALEIISKVEKDAVAVLTRKMVEGESPANSLAATALSLINPGEFKKHVNSLLQINDPIVVYRASIDLISLGDRKGVSALIQSLDKLGPKERSQAECLLRKIAGENGPTLNLSPKDTQKIWQDWEKKGQNLNATLLAESAKSLGQTLVILLDQGQALYLGKNNGVLWKIDNLQFPLDAQIITGNRFLFVEHQGNRVTERNPKGEIFWEKKVDGPVAALRQKDGNTFIACKTQVLFVNGKGEEVTRFSPGNGETIMKGVSLSDGGFALILSTLQGNSRFARFNKEHKEVASFDVDVRTSGGKFDVLPNGNLLITEIYNNKVIEFSSEGKQVWSHTCEQPVAAVRLPNGNTLITSMTQLRAFEITKEGIEVWSFKSETRVTRAFRP